MNSRQPANFARNRPDLREFSSVGPTAFPEHVLAKDLFLQVRECLSGPLASLGLIFRIRIDDLLFQRIDGGVACELVLSGRIQSSPKPVAEILFHFSYDIFVDRRWREFTFRNVERLS